MKILNPFTNQLKSEIMKTIKTISAALFAVVLVFTGCTKENVKIEGEGPIVSQDLVLDDFSAIEVTGADNVVITYGPVQSVTVEGQANIISRINREVRNNTWSIKLQNGNYGNYELTYNLTLPALEEVVNEGTGDVSVVDFADQEYLSVSLIGTGSFFGYPMKVRQADVFISGSSDCEMSVEERLDVTIEGSGNVYYKGSPVLHTDITGSGSVHAVNQ